MNELEIADWYVNKEENIKDWHERLEEAESNMDKAFSILEEVGTDATNDTEWESARLEHGKACRVFREIFQEQWIEDVLDKALWAESDKLYEEWREKMKDPEVRDRAIRAAALRWVQDCKDEEG